MSFTLEAMRLPLEALGYEIRGELPVYRISHRGNARENREVLAKAQELGVRLAEILQA